MLSPDSRSLAVIKIGEWADGATGAVPFAVRGQVA
jgi:hypothetical protein